MEIHPAQRATSPVTQYAVIYLSGARIRGEDTLDSRARAHLSRFLSISRLYPDLFVSVRIHILRSRSTAAGCVITVIRDMRNGGFFIYKKEADKKDFRPIGSVGINARFFGACIRRISYCAVDVYRIEHDVYKKKFLVVFCRRTARLLQRLARFDRTVWSPEIEIKRLIIGILGR